MVPVRDHFQFRLNGRTVMVRGEPAQTTLLDFVRSKGLTGAKEGCAEGECGACAVLLVGSRPGGEGAAYRSVNSCLMPLPSVADLEIYTVEALADSRDLAEVQRAMVEQGGSQCGYCTPGFIVSMFAEQYRNAPGFRSFHALGGNLCRCTGYRPIQDAFQSLGEAPAGAFRDRLQKPSLSATALRYESQTGKYSRPATLTECLDLAEDDPSAKFVGGNTDLGLLTNVRDERHTHLIGLEAIAELREFRNCDDTVEIGAALTFTEIQERWTDAPAVIDEWRDLFASVLIRNRATLGGNLATASPIGDAAPLLLAMSAEVRIVGAHGERVIPLSEFFVGYRQTTLVAGELIRAIRISKPFPQISRFFKVAKRRMDDISTVAAGISLNRDSAGMVKDVRIGLGGVATTPVRAREAERVLEGTLFSSSDAEHAAEVLRHLVHPIDDHRGSAAYRRAVAANLIRKFHHEEIA